MIKRSRGYTEEVSASGHVVTCPIRLCPRGCCAKPIKGGQTFSVQGALSVSVILCRAPKLKGTPDGSI